MKPTRGSRRHSNREGKQPSFSLLFLFPPFSCFCAAREKDPSAFDGRTPRWRRRSERAGDGGGRERARATAWRGARGQTRARPNLGAARTRWEARYGWGEEGREEVRAGGGKGWGAGEGAGGALNLICSFNPPCFPSLSSSGEPAVFTSRCFT